MYQDLELT